MIATPICCTIAYICTLCVLYMPFISDTSLKTLYSYFASTTVDPLNIDKTKDPMNRYKGLFLQIRATFMKVAEL